MLTVLCILSSVLQSVSLQKSLPCYFTPYYGMGWLPVGVIEPQGDIKLSEVSFSSKHFSDRVHSLMLTEPQ